MKVLTKMFGISVNEQNISTQTVAYCTFSGIVTYANNLNKKKTHTHEKRNNSISISSKYVVKNNI